MPEKTPKLKLEQLSHEEIRERLKKYDVDTTNWEAPSEVDDIRMMPSRTHITPYEEGRRMGVHRRADIVLLEWIKESGRSSRKQDAMKKVWSKAYVEAEKARKRSETNPDKSPD